MATVTGTSGNDNLNGTSGNDTLNGLGGNDTLIASGGTDFYDGGAGIDTLDLRLTAAGVVVSFSAGTIGGSFNGTFVNMERVLGSNGADSVIGAAGNQNLSGRGGNDTLAGGVGNDTLWGGGGDADRFIFRETGTANADRIADFTSGADKIVLDAAVMTALGANGTFAAGDARFVANATGTAQDSSDRVIFNTTTRQVLYDADGNGSGAAVLVATLQSGATLAATDIVVEGGGPAPIVGTEGNDTLNGTDGNDTIDGRGGNDSLFGGDGADSMAGGSGNDTLNSWWDNHGDSLVDTLDGGLGDDVYFVTDDGDIILPDPGGVDTVEIDTGSWTLGEGLENLRVWEGSGIGNELDNVMSGGQHFQGMGGNDLLITESPGIRHTTTAHGGDGNDTLVGGGLRTRLFGDAGDDVLTASTEPFEPGPNELTGGTGTDRFVFEAAGFTENLILDFATGGDAIVLDGTAMANLGASGRFGATDARFTANSSGTAQDQSDRVIYNTSTGELWYDANGNGFGAAALIATLQGAPALAASDIEVINGTRPINGTAGNDVLEGTAADDTIDGLGGNDLITGNGGADSLRGSDGNDTLIGGEAWSIPGRPEFIGSGRDDAVDTLDGGLGDDVYHVSGPDQDGDVIIADAGGIDTVFAWNSDWTLGPGLENLMLADDAGVASNGTGNELDNRIESATEGGTLLGLGGNDTLIARVAENTVTMRGGDGDDTLLSNGAVGAGIGNQLFGDAGNDLLVGRGGNSHMTGGAGADVFYFDTVADPVRPDFQLPEDHELITDFASGTDTIRLDGARMPALGPSGDFSATDARFAANSTGTAQDSSDRVIYNTSTGDLWYDPDGSGASERLYIGLLQGAPALAASDIEVVNGGPQGRVINGTSGADTLAGTAGNDTLNGLGGNDMLVGSGGTDVYDGGAGIDTLDLRAAGAGVTVFFGFGGGSGMVSGGFNGTFVNMERALGSNGADSLRGGDGNQNLSGRGGNDTLEGSLGNDTLWGGGGDADRFVFGHIGTANADTVSDFTSGADEFAFENSVMSALGAAGDFVAGDARFWASSTGTAHDANDRILFNSSSGQLYYDADGNGAGAAQLIATVQAGATVVATDIVVI